ncbi:enoyl-[acyl-carrier-protein] reductase, mitochondrial-like isoform X2 [Salmo trutta]|uniref:enoyl-[acyl-carrier-protein] reductase, mitochondrial-like isoform X2 n=1 Tax=Salmo trutta TaxID=8032 RepID=UPI001130A076|nr:enoyl-[acyl-carrier-protein] reductase, mitochondrial-like isoform X2 [Salmo trutta]
MDITMTQSGTWRTEAVRRIQIAQEKSLIFKNITLQVFWMAPWKRNNSKDVRRLQAMVTSVCGLVKSTQHQPPQFVQVPFHHYSQALLATVQAHQRKHGLLM